MYGAYCVIFFFQAEDGIRDYKVTGVQTCALPISGPYGATLSVFNGTDPNGDWLLYIMDDQGSDAGAVHGGWRLTFMTGPGAPLLRAERSGGSIILSWPVSADGFVLESQDVLSSRAWSLVTSSPPIVGSRYTVSVSVGTGSKFF